MLKLNPRYMSSKRTSMSARRRARDRRDAELTRTEGEQIAWEKQQLKIRQKLEMQRQAREDLSSYEPWGKAGGGAPNSSGVRFTNLRTGEIYPEDELRGVAQHEACRQFASPRRRMRRTPIRLREDPQLCYGDTCKNTVDNHLRYRQTPEEQRAYKQDLDDLVETRKKQQREHTRRETEYHIMMKNVATPWGKPGPGGTTWRDPRDIGLNFTKSMGWTDNEIFNKIKGDHKRYKSTSLTLPDVKKGEVSYTTKPSSIAKLPQIRQQTESQNYGKHYYQNNKVKNRNETTQSLYQKPLSTRIRVSPRKKSRFVKRLPNGERIKRHVPEELPRNTDHTVDNGEKKPTPEETMLRLTGGIELVPLLARRRRVGARTLHSSDVTRPQDQCCQWREMLNMDYLKELKNQIKVKYHQQEVKRQDSAESVRVHHETWASLWGRPGHGAPQQRGKYARNNLTKLLYLNPMGSREAVSSTDGARHSNYLTNVENMRTSSSISGIHDTIQVTCFSRLTQFSAEKKVHIKLNVAQPGSER